MTDDDNVLTLDSININPAFDFLSHYSSAIPADDDDNPANIISPYSNIDMCCKYFDETEFANEFKLKNEQLFLNLNIQSLPAKFNELEEFIIFLKNNCCEPDFICLQETWRIFDQSLFNIDGYNLEIKSRSSNTQGGGVGIYIKKVFAIIYSKNAQSSSTKFLNLYLLKFMMNHVNILLDLFIVLIVSTLTLQVMSK